MMSVPDPETVAGPWTAVDVRGILDRVLRAPRPVDRPSIVTVDGRSGSGKSTLAAHLHRAAERSAIVHTDDLAWNEPFFSWGGLLRDGVIVPVRAGRDVQFRPPAWGRHGRPGAVVVPAGLDLVIVEGVGAGQRGVDDLVDAGIWVQSDFAEAERRGIVRDEASGDNGGHDAAIAFWHEWMSHETAFLSQDRPWTRARLIVAGTPTIALDDGQWAVADCRR